VCVVQPYHYHVHVITTRQPVSSRSYGIQHPEDEERTLFVVKATAVLRSNATGAEAEVVVLDSGAWTARQPSYRPSIGTWESLSAHRRQRNCRRRPPTTQRLPAPGALLLFTALAYDAIDGGTGFGHVSGPAERLAHVHHLTGLAQPSLIMAVKKKSIFDHLTRRAVGLGSEMNQMQWKASPAWKLALRQRLGACLVPKNFSKNFYILCHINLWIHARSIKCR
jgi:hypothetical protein